MFIISDSIRFYLIVEFFGNIFFEVGVEEYLSCFFFMEFIM